MMVVTMVGWTDATMVDLTAYSMVDYSDRMLVDSRDDSTVVTMGYPMAETLVDW